jgi:hypothetical protein
MYGRVYLEEYAGEKAEECPGYREKDGLTPTGEDKNGRREATVGVLGRKSDVGA